jgi:hypothetical protein
MNEKKKQFEIPILTPGDVNTAEKYSQYWLKLIRQGRIGYLAFFVL